MSSSSSASSIPNYNNYDTNNNNSNASSASASACIYLDYNGTTPVYKPVLNAMIPYLTTHFGNPSSSHYYGQHPKRAVHRARLQIMELLGLQAEVLAEDDAECIVFTGCGTEADNLAIYLAVKASTNKVKHVITTNVEHPAVIQ